MTPRFLHRFLLAIIATLASINMSAVRGEGPILFVSSFAKGEAGGIQALRLSSEDGGLLPLARTGGIENPFFLAVSPDGRFLYGTNRGHDSLAIFRVGEDGVLTRVGIVPSLGKGPQNLLVTPDGKWLLCANMPGNNLAVFRIDGETGNLTSAGAPLEIPMPSCIRILP